MLERKERRKRKMKARRKITGHIQAVA